MAKVSRSSSLIQIIFLLIFVVIFGANYCKKSPSSSKKTEVSAAGYQIKFDDSFSKGLAAQDDLGLSVVLALDCSGSMDEFATDKDQLKKYQIAAQSLNEIVGFLSDFYRNKVKKEGMTLKIGVLKFSDTVTVVYPLTNMQDENFKELLAITENPDNFKPESKTAIGKTLEQGTEMLAQSGTIFKSLIIITDGENTSGIEPEKVFDAMVNNKNNKNTKDFPVTTDTILTSFVGFNVSSDVFSKLNQLGARVLEANNKLELDNSLKNIFMADITRLESK